MNQDQFTFTGKFKRSLLIMLVVGVVMAAIGFFAAGPEAPAEHGAHGEEHAALAQTENMLAEAAVEDHPAQQGHTAQDGAETDAHAGDHGEVHADDHGEHHGAAYNVKRLFANLWVNNMFFMGLAIVGLFFVAIQYVTEAGWSAAIIRVPLTFGHWIPIGGALILLVWLVSSHDLFHWTHADLYDPESPSYDPIIAGKEGYLNTAFYLVRMVAIVLLWTLFFYWIKAQVLKEDQLGGNGQWYKLKKISAGFLVVFAVTSSVGAWDWIMSIDTHWFSTMFGWYVFASWFVSGMALFTLVITYLKEKGYFPQININHIHDLGKFVFGFSIFWTYIWFSQFFLIYYANIPEEAVYFVERLDSDRFAPFFYVNFIVNFVMPFLLLMTRESKRHFVFLRMVTIIVLVGHWVDFYLMIMPGTLGHSAGFGFMEIGVTLVFAAAFSWVGFSALAKVPLVGKHHPMLEESLHHDI